MKEASASRTAGDSTHYLTLQYFKSKQIPADMMFIHGIYIFLLFALQGLDVSLAARFLSPVSTSLLTKKSLIDRQIRNDQLVQPEQSSAHGVNHISASIDSLSSSHCYGFFRSAKADSLSTTNTTEASNHNNITSTASTTSPITTPLSLSITPILLLKRFQRNFMEFEDSLQSMVKSFPSSMSILLKKTRHGTSSLNYDEYEQVTYNLFKDISKLFNLYYSSFFYSKYIYILKIGVPFFTTLGLGQAPSTWKAFPIAMTSPKNQEISRENIYFGKFPALFMVLSELKKYWIACREDGSFEKCKRMEQGFDLIGRALQVLQQSPVKTNGGNTNNKDSNNKAINADSSSALSFEDEKLQIEKAMEILEPFYVYKRLDKSPSQSSFDLLNILPSTLREKVVESGNKRGDRAHNRILNTGNNKENTSTASKNKNLLFGGLPLSVIQLMVHAFGERPYPALPIIGTFNKNIVNKHVQQIREEDDFLSAIGVDSLNIHQLKKACLKR